MDSTTTACFSGYRPQKFSFILLNGQEAYLALEARIKAEIMKAVDEGFDTFLCGMAMGFDLVCGNIALQLKQDQPEFRDIRLVAVLTFPPETSPCKIVDMDIVMRRERCRRSAIARNR